MSFNITPFWIDETDIDIIAPISQNCAWDTLSVYIREQQELYILPKIEYCFFNAIQENPTDTEVLKVLNGSTYDHFGIIKYQFGLKRVLAHLTYGVYVFRKGYVDTPFGVVQKLNQDSVPAPITELKSIKSEHHNIASNYMTNVMEYVNTLYGKGVFIDCKCEGKGSIEVNRGIKLVNVTNHDEGLFNPDYKRYNSNGNWHRIN